jgi:hypothetical protein
VIRHVGGLLKRGKLGQVAAKPRKENERDRLGVALLDDFQQIQGGQQIIFSDSVNLLASLNLLERNGFHQT